ncbi:alpha-glucan water dikinase, chloroplastic-like protein [Corchorus olitorius]|uniref:Alpha-glucan water dikinase, chloroplastic-like protein n=1 Tax=Corchorus olitorius TaxID=93759 RepID=A0A1R3HT53_9ROSI|nr:alpha-glucan water dikinase, chloroplastic-like protein [Corchorus olitorius]
MIDLFYGENEMLMKISTGDHRQPQHRSLVETTKAAKIPDPTLLNA